jgi:hypothetical protein
VQDVDDWKTCCVRGLRMPLQNLHPECSYLLSKLLTTWPSRLIQTRFLCFGDCWLFPVLSQFKTLPSKRPALGEAKDNFTGLGFQVTQSKQYCFMHPHGRGETSERRRVSTAHEHTRRAHQQAAPGHDTGGLQRYI